MAETEKQCRGYPHPSEKLEHGGDAQRLEALVDDSGLDGVGDDAGLLFEPAAGENLTVNREFVPRKSERVEAVDKNEHGAPNSHDHVESEEVKRTCVS